MPRRYASRVACEALEPRALRAATLPLQDLDAAPAQSGLIPVLSDDGVLFCTKRTAAGTEVWRTDGTARGTVRLAATHGGQPACNFTAFGSGSVAFTVGGELWATTASPRAAHQVADVDPSFQPTEPAMNPFTGVVAVGRRLYVDSAAGLYLSDGTAAGTGLLAEYPMAQVNDDTPAVIAAGDNVAYLCQAASSIQPTTDTLYRTDGTAVGTTQVATGVVVRGMAVVDQTLIYITAASSGLIPVATDLDLWSLNTDSATATPTLVRTFANGNLSVGEDLKAVDGGVAVFVVGGGGGDDLWRTDGTAAGTTMLASDLANNGGGTELVPAGPRVYFQTPAIYGSVEAHVWASDGTAAGTLAVYTGAAYEDGLIPIHGSPDGSAAYAVQENPTANQPATVYRTDGTAAAPVVLAEGVANVTLAVPGGAFVDYATDNDNQDQTVATEAWFAGPGADPAGAVIGPVPSVTPGLTVSERAGRYVTHAVARVTVTNHGPERISGRVSLQLFVSSVPTVTVEQVEDATLSTESSPATAVSEVAAVTLVLRLPPGRLTRLAIPLSDTTPGTTGPAYLVAVIDAKGTLPFADLDGEMTSAALAP